AGELPAPPRPTGRRDQEAVWSPRGGARPARSVAEAGALRKARNQVGPDDAARGRRPDEVFRLRRFQRRLARVSRKAQGQLQGNLLEVISHQSNPFRGRFLLTTDD